MAEQLSDLPSVVSRRARVFLVEDDPGTAAVIRSTLEDLGCDVAGQATSGEAVLAAIGTVHPDLVLLDVNLAGSLDGIETANKMRVRFDVPIVFVTGQEDEETIARLRSVEPLACVFKPFRDHQLRTAVELALHHRERERQQRERQRAIAITLRAIDDAVIAVDDSGRITFMNDAAEHLTRLRELDVRGRRIGEVLHLEDPAGKAPLVDAVTASLEQRRSVKPRTAILVTGAGRRTIEDGAAPLFDDNGRIFGGVMVIRELEGRGAPESAGAPGGAVPSQGILVEVAAAQRQVGEHLDALEAIFRGLTKLLALYRQAHRGEGGPDSQAVREQIAEGEKAAASSGLHRGPKLFERVRDALARLAPAGPAKPR